MEGILFGFFIGALFGAAAVVVVQGIIRNRQAAAWAKYAVTGANMESPESPPSDPLPNIMRHNNLDWMKKGASE